jgi:hypothetical protein
MSPFINFQKFSTEAQAKELIDLLVENLVPYEIEDNTPESVSLIANQGLREIRIKLHQEDFERVNALLESMAREGLGEVTADYYLFEFSESELMEILEKPDEWGKNDYALALKILRERGMELSQEKVEALKEQRMKELSKPEGGQEGWIIAGYSAAIGGGILGIFIGWHLLTFKKTLPDGKKIFAYTPSSRKHGQRILYIAVPCLIFWLFFILRRRILEAS